MQFSLRAILVFVALISMYCGLTFALPVPLSLVGLTFLTFLCPPAIVGGIIYARGTIRAFWIGCAASGFIPLIVAMYLGFSITIAAFGDFDEFEDGGRWYCAGLAFCHVLVAVDGLIVVAMRWFSRGFRPATPEAEAPASSVIHRRVLVDEPAASTARETCAEESRIG